MDPDPELFRYIVPGPDSTVSKKKKQQRSDSLFAKNVKTSVSDFKRTVENVEEIILHTQFN